ncbi:MAG: pantoate--beta-alanine ligase [Acidobacteriota bacterium]
MTLRIIENLTEFKTVRNGLTGQVALVPTMGALHEGHFSLVRKALEAADQVVVSIFVNPTQFGPGEDLDRYPRTLDDDLQNIEKLGVGFVLLPSAQAVYPPGYRTYVQVEDLENKLCGRFRPGHFRGVATVVLKLLNLTRPHVVLFGQKDAQQWLLLQRMILDLHLDVQLLVCPIVREPDGLAMSSRNRYLTPGQRAAAPVLHLALQDAERQVQRGQRSAARILKRVQSHIEQEPLVRLQYAEIVDLKNLEPVEHLDEECLLALAALVGTSRLIDNTILIPR